MTWKQFVRRFNEMMADTSTTPLGVTDLEAWHKKQKQITESCLWEEEEKRELAKKLDEAGCLCQGLSTQENMDVPSVHLCGYPGRKAYACNSGAPSQGNGEMPASGYYRFL